MTMKKENGIEVKHIKNSVVIISGGPLDMGVVEKAVKEFDMADKTPLDCFDFLRKLKSMF